MDNPMFQRQVELEAESLNLGITRYRRNRANKGESDLKPGKVLVHRVLDALVDRIEKEIREITEGKAKSGKPSIYGSYLQEVPTEAAAFITTKVVINECVKPNASFTHAAVRIGTLIEEHVVFTDLASTQPKLFNQAQRKANKSTTEHHKRYTLRHAVKVGEENHPDTVTGLKWTDSDKLHLGSKLIELLLATALIGNDDDIRPLFEAVTIREGRKRKSIIRATFETMDWLNKIHSSEEVMSPVQLPMIVPPRKWTNPLNGGYLTTKLPFVKKVKAGVLDDLFSIEMPEVYRAVNTLQVTPWRINKAVMDVILELNATGSSLGGLPSPTEVVFPNKLPDMDAQAKARTPEFVEWLAATAQAHETKARETSRNVALAQQMFVAKKFADEDEIFFPHNIDFRGRIYPIPTALNPQGDDRSKGMLEFAHGKPLGEDGAYWLAVHVANCFGEDKLALDDRVRWVEDNEKHIMDAGINPLDGQRFWADADKPFCALAACIEWTGYRIEGDAYVSHLPIAMDGTCSGLQHYSALLRDPVGGAAVNLVPSETPADIYSRVADAVQARVADDPAWAGRVTRKIVKQPCMTYAYSSTLAGMRDQIVVALRKEHESDALGGHDYFSSALALAPIVREEIRNCVIAASAAMDWLQECTRLMSALNQPVVWSTPLGLAVRQANMKSKTQRVKIFFQGSTQQLSLSHDTKKIDSRSQTNGIAPNYIHSLDSSHLMSTVLAAHDEGIQDFAMIHDSFGTHACNTSLFNMILRAEFVEQYQPNLLDRFRTELIERLPAGTVVPPVPPMADLDIQSVMDSEFFFS